MLRPVLGAHVKRGFQSRSGRDGCDVEGTDFWIEAKHHHLVDVRVALGQALEATDGRPVVVVAKDGKKPPAWRPGLPSAQPFVVMRLDDWLALAGGAQNCPDLPAAEPGVPPFVSAREPECEHTLDEFLRGVTGDAVEGPPWRFAPRVTLRPVRVAGEIRGEAVMDGVDLVHLVLAALPAIGPEAPAGVGAATPDAQSADRGGEVT